MPARRPAPRGRGGSVAGLGSRASLLHAAAAVDLPRRRVDRARAARAAARRRPRARRCGRRRRGAPAEPRRRRVGDREPAPRRVAGRAARPRRRSTSEAESSLLRVSVEAPSADEARRTAQERRRGVDRPLQRPLRAATSRRSGRPRAPTEDRVSPRLARNLAARCALGRAARGSALGSERPALRSSAGAAPARSSFPLAEPRRSSPPRRVLPAPCRADRAPEPCARTRSPAALRRVDDAPTSSACSPSMARRSPSRDAELGSYLDSCPRSSPAARRVVAASERSESSARTA